MASWNYYGKPNAINLPWLGMIVTTHQNGNDLARWIIIGFTIWMEFLRMGQKHIKKNEFVTIHLFTNKVVDLSEYCNFETLPYIYVYVYISY